jgi:hypothetical protein
MSQAEITMGAHLYVQAVDAGLPAVLKNGAERAEADDYRNLQLALRDMSRALIKSKAVSKDEAGRWSVNDAGISALSEDDNDKMIPLYQTVVKAHEASAPSLIADGKEDYVKSFRDLHSQTIIEIEPETVSRVHGEDMQSIVTTSLNLLDAVREDPANAAFIKGLDTESMKSLWNVLETSNYLMPGENPDREAPIGEQVLRGTSEEQEALFYQASAIVSNMDLPEKINQGDRAATSAMMLQSAVSGARIEDVEIDRYSNSSPDAFFDSDLTKADANSLFNLMNVGTRLVHNAQFDTASLGNLLVPDALVDDVKVALVDYEEKGIENALKSGNFEAPNIDATRAKRIAKGIDMLRDAVETDPHQMSYTGDDGGTSTESSAGANENAEANDAFDNAFDEDSSADADAVETTTGDEDMAADRYGKSDKFTRLTESMVMEWDIVSAEMMDNGTIETLRQHAGRAETDMSDMYASQAAFGTFEEAMGSDRVATTPEMTNKISEAMSHAQWGAMSPDRRGRMRAAVVKPGQGPFREYKPASSTSAAKRITTFIDKNMVDKDGKPNVDMRRFLRDAVDTPVVASSRQEAEAVRTYATKFRDREQDEFKARTEAGREKRGITSFELSATEVGRFIDVAEASGSEAPAKMVMNKDGSVSVSHPEAPKMTSKLSSIPKEVENSDKSPRPFGGQITTEQLKAAYQTGAEKIQVLIDGERPYGIIGKIEDAAPVKKATRKFEDVVLS